MCGDKAIAFPLTTKYKCKSRILFKNSLLRRKSYLKLREPLYLNLSISNIYAGQINYKTQKFIMRNIKKDFLVRRKFNRIVNKIKIMQKEREISL